MAPISTIAEVRDEMQHHQRSFLDFLEDGKLFGAPFLTSYIPNSRLALERLCGATNGARYG